MEFTVLKTKVMLSPIFFAVLTVFLLIDRYGIALPAVLISFCHEIGHFFASLCVKSRPAFLKLSLFGIQMGLPYNLSTGKKMLVLMAGFTVNFILSIILFAVGAKTYGCISLFIGIFTALPMSSTDGGEVLAAFLEEFFPENSDRIFQTVSTFSSFSVIFLLCMVGFSAKNAFLIIPIIYILIMALKK